MYNVTVVIKTFLRFKSLLGLLDSIEKFYPGIPVIVVDDGNESNKGKLREYNIDLTYIEAPFYIGCCKGRNQALELIKTEYFLLCDDDFIFDKRTDIENSLTLLKKKNIDILGGYLRNKIVPTARMNVLKSSIYKIKNLLDLEKESSLIGYFSEEEPQELVIKKFKGQFPRFKECDFVYNFFIARTDIIKKLGWNENLKTTEHTEFFVRAKHNNIRVAFSNLLSITHRKSRNKDYDNYRFKKDATIKAINEICKLGYKKITILTDGKDNETWIKGADGLNKVKYD